MPLLEINGVRKSFGARVVLDHICLTVERGECIVLVGPSGSGKSTLLRCINLLETIDDGTLHLDGEEISDPRANADRIRARMGFVFQAFNLFPHLSVIENVTLAPIKVHRRPRAAAQAAALAMLTRIGLAEKALAKPDELSGGQQQRVAIVRALLNEPMLMLLDEITSALDPELVGEVLGLLRELKSEGLTMIIATHEMGFARQMADRVCVLDQGRLLEVGPPAQVLGTPREPRTREFLRRILADR
jgi:polar amino acid transport system ATP-binding protein